MMTEQEEIWERLMYGVHKNITAVVFGGDGTATKFNSGWVSGSKVLRVTVDDVAQSQFRDFKIINNDIIFKKAPPAGASVAIEVYY